MQDDDIDTAIGWWVAERDEQGRIYPRPMTEQEIDQLAELIDDATTTTTTE